MKSSMAIFILVFLAACATKQPAHYAKDNASQGEFEEISYRCFKKTTTGGPSELRTAHGKVGEVKGSVNCDKFNACMASSGFVKSAKGEFVVKDFAEVDCKQ